MSCKFNELKVQSLLLVITHYSVCGVRVMKYNTETVYIIFTHSSSVKWEEKKKTKRA